MAALTWRDVAAPDFRGAMQGYSQFSQMLDSAFGKASAAVQNIDNIQTDGVNAAIMADILAAQDTDQAKQLAASVGQRSDLARVRDTTFAALAARPGALLEQEAAEGNLDFTNWTRTNTKADRAALDAARPDAARLLDAYTKGDDNAAQQILANSPTLRALPSEALFDMISGGQSITAKDIGLDSSRLGLEENQYGFTQQKLNDSESRQAQEIAMTMISQTTDPELILQGISGLDIPGPVKARALQIAMGTGFTGSAGGGGGGSTGGGGALSFGGAQGNAEAHTAVASTLRGAGLPDAAIAGFLGNFHVEGGYGGAQGDGGSAGGIAQWRKERRDNFKRIIGKDPTQATIEEQARFVAWELANPTSGAFVPKDGLSPQEQVERIKNARTPAEAAELIDRYYERSDGKHRSRRVDAANHFASNFLTTPQLNEQADTVGATIADRLNGDVVQEVTNSFLEGWNDNTTPAAVASALIAEGGDFAGGNKSDVLGLVNQIRQEYGVSAAVAGAMLRLSATEQSLGDWFSQLAGPTMGSRELGGVSINDDRLKELGSVMQNRTRVAEGVATGSRLNQNLATIATARSNLAAAEQALAAARRPADIAIAQQRVTAAKAAFAEANRGGAGNSGLPVTSSTLLEQAVRGGGRNQLPSEANLYEQFLRR